MASTGSSSPTPTAAPALFQLLAQGRALWNIFTHEGMRSNVINWWASHPAEPINGCVVTNAFRRRGVRSGNSGRLHHRPRHGASGRQGGVLRPIQGVSQRDHAATCCSPSCPKAAEVNQDEDPRLESLAKLICRNGHHASGRHGRDGVGAVGLHGRLFHRHRPFLACVHALSSAADAQRAGKGFRDFQGRGRPGRIASTT